MNEERLLVLKMVSEGKLTPEEAESLLRTLDETVSRQADIPNTGLSSVRQTAHDAAQTSIRVMKQRMRELQHDIRNLHSEAHGTRKRAQKQRAQKQRARKRSREHRQRNTDLHAAVEAKREDCQCSPEKKDSEAGVQ